MDTDKEGTVTASAQEAIGDAAKANVNAAVEVAKSAVTAFVGALTGEPQKPKKQSTRKKAAAKGAGSKSGKAKRSTGARKSASATGRKTTRKSAPKRRSSTGRSNVATRTRKSATTKATRKSGQAKRTTSKSRTSQTRGVLVSAARAKGGVERYKGKRPRHGRHTGRRIHGALGAINGTHRRLYVQPHSVEAMNTQKVLMSEGRPLTRTPLLYVAIAGGTSMSAASPNCHLHLVGVGIGTDEVMFRDIAGFSNPNRRDASFPWIINSDRGCAGDDWRFGFSGSWASRVSGVRHGMTTRPLGQKLGVAGTGLTY